MRVGGGYVTGVCNVTASAHRQTGRTANCTTQRQGNEVGLSSVNSTLAPELAIRVQLSAEYSQE